MKTMNKNCSKRGSKYPFAALCTFLFMTALSFFPVHKAQADPSLLTGTYVIREFSAAFGGGDPNGGWGSNDEWSLGNIVVTFDDVGNFTATSTESGFQRQISEVSKNVGSLQNPDNVLSNKFATTPTSYTDPGVSGTYEITADGRFILHFMDNGGPGSVSGWVSQNGQTVVFGESQYEPANFWGRVGLGVGVKKGTAMPSRIAATYVLHEFGGGFGGTDPNGGWGSNDERYIGTIEIAFQTDGTFTVTHSSLGVNRQIFEVSKDFGGNQVLSNKFITTTSDDPSGILNGTYNITSEGQFTLTFTDQGGPGSVVGWVSANGQSVVFGQTEYESLSWAGLSLGVGVKKGSALNPSSFYGAYGLFTMDSGVHSTDPNGGWGSGDDLTIDQGLVIINPDGTWSVSSNKQEIDRQIWEVTPPWSGQDQVLSNKFSTTQHFGPDSETGTYEFSSDGTVTLHFMDNGVPGSVTVHLSEDGQTGVFGMREFKSGPTDYYGSAQLGVVVRKAVQDVPLTYSISGVVTYSGGLTGTLKVFAFYNNGSSRYPYAQVVGNSYSAPWNPTSGTQSYMITGLPPGTYQLVAYLDADGAGPRAPGELVATQTGLAVVSGNLAGQNFTLGVPAFQFSGQEKVFPMKRGDQNNEVYLTFWAGIPDASAVQVQSGPGITTPINLQHDTMNGSVWSSGVTNTPQTGIYGFNATYAVDSSHLTTNVNLASAPTPPEPATLVSPYEGTPNKEMFLTTNKPTFTWNAVTGAQAYLLRIDQMIDAQWVRIYDSGWGSTGATHTAQMPLPSGVPLRWYVDASNSTQWSSTTAMSRSVRQRFTIAGPRSISGTVNVPGYSGSGPINISVYLSEDGTFNPASENLLGTDVINPGEYTSGVNFYVIPNLPVGALVYVAARWDADGDGVPSEGDYLGKVGPLTVTAAGLLDVNLALQTRYAEDQGAPYFAWCNVQAFNTPSGMQASFTVQVFDPNGSVPDTITSLTVTGPSQTYSFEFASSEAIPGNVYWHGIPDLSPQLGWYTFTVTDNEGKTATSRCYWPGGTYIPFPSASSLQASGNALTPTLSWAAPSNYSGDLFYRARIFDSTGVNTIWTSGFTSGSSIVVPTGILSQGLSYQWRVEAFNNYRYEASNHRAASGKVALTIDDSKPYFNYATVFHRKDSADSTQIAVNIVDPDGNVPSTIQSLDVYAPQDTIPRWTIQDFTYDPTSNEFSAKISGAPSAGVYKFVVTDTSSNTKTTYDYVGATFAIPIVDSNTFQASGDASAPTLSWGAPTGMDRPLFYQAIVEDLQGIRVWGSDRISDTMVQVPGGMLQSGVSNYQLQVRTTDSPFGIHFSNQGRSSKLGLTMDNAKPYFKRVAVYKRFEPGGGPYIFMDAMVNDPNGSLPDTIAVLKVTDPNNVEYDLLPPNGTYSSPADQEFIRKVSGTPTQGVYTFTLTDTEGKTAVTRDWVGTAADIPLVSSSSIVILGDPMSPTVGWSAVSGYQGNLYYRIYVQDSQGNLVYRSSRDPITAQTIPMGILMPGRFYSVRVEAQDHWMFGVYNVRSNSDIVTWLARENGVAGGAGDVDGNGYVTLADAIMALQVVTGMNPAGVHVSADVNADGKIGPSEAIYILQYVAGVRP